MALYITTRSGRRRRSRQRKMDAKAEKEIDDVPLLDLTQSEYPGRYKISDNDNDDIQIFDLNLNDEFNSKAASKSILEQADAENNLKQMSNNSRLEHGSITLRKAESTGALKLLLVQARANEFNSTLGASIKPTPEQATDSAGTSDSFIQQRLEQVNAMRTPLRNASAINDSNALEFISGVRASDNSEIADLNATLTTADNKLWFTEIEAKTSVKIPPFEAEAAPHSDNIQIDSKESLKVLLEKEKTERLFNNVVDISEYTQQNIKLQNLMQEFAIAKADLQLAKDSQAIKTAESRVEELQQNYEAQAKYFDSLQLAGSAWNRNNRSDDLLKRAAKRAQTIKIMENVKLRYDALSTYPKYASETPEGLLVPLMLHQKEALTWVKWREEQPCSGGILADDMGLGKTITMLAIMLHTKNNKHKNVVENKLELKEKHKIDTEIELKSRSENESEAKLNLEMDINQKEDSDADTEYDEFCALDMNKFRRNLNQIYKNVKHVSVATMKKLKKDVNESSNRKRQHISEDDSDDDELWESTYGKRRRNQNGGTLIVCPVSVMFQWKKEILEKVRIGKLNVHVYHGTNRADLRESLAVFDVVITSFNTLAVEFKEYYCVSQFFSINWLRVILDEAHIIRNTVTACFQSVLKLTATHRWALTGTPIQNRAKDAIALLSFLKVASFDEIKEWNRWLRINHDGHRRLSFLIRPMLMRRTKAELVTKGILPKLPEKHIHYIDIELNKEEIQVYELMLGYSRNMFAQYLRQKESRNEDLQYFGRNMSAPSFVPPGVEDKYIKLHQKFLDMITDNHTIGRIKLLHIFVLLLRLRQFCCHPGLAKAILYDDATELNNFASQDDASFRSMEIDIINEANNDTMYDEDLNDFDNLLFAFQSQSSDESTTEKLDKTVIDKILSLSNPIFDLELPSSKLTSVLETLENLIQNTDDKIIVVSQWVGYLNVIKNHLSKRNIDTLDFNGKIPLARRQDVISQFHDSASDIRIMLLSLTIGGVGLNLIAANHLLMVDLHWNPQMEQQAEDRIYRLGQEKEINIYRFCCKATVEERIKALQQHKLEIANVVLNGHYGMSTSSISIYDLMMLFENKKPSA